MLTRGCEDKHLGRVRLGQKLHAHSKVCDCERSSVRRTDVIFDLDSIVLGSLLSSGAGPPTQIPCGPDPDTSHGSAVATRLAHPPPLAFQYYIYPLRKQLRMEPLARKTYVLDPKISKLFWPKSTPPPSHKELFLVEMRCDFGLRLAPLLLLLGVLQLVLLPLQHNRIRYCLGCAGLQYSSSR
jgi:hypothetical protein